MIFSYHGKSGKKTACRKSAGGFSGVDTLQRPPSGAPEGKKNAFQGEIIVPFIGPNVKGAGLYFQAPPGDFVPIDCKLRQLVQGQGAEVNFHFFLEDCYQFFVRYGGDSVLRGPETARDFGKHFNLSVCHGE